MLSKVPLIDHSIATRSNEIKSQPYAQYVVAEDSIARNFDYKIIRQQVASGRNSLVYRCETVKHPNCHCIVKSYRLGKDKIKLSLKEEVCQILRYVSGKCPSIISTYDIFFTNDKIYMMCDWTLNGEVSVHLRNKSIKLNESMLHTWTCDILQGINFLHNNAICHRNIAPNSLLLTGDNHVKLGSLSDACIYCKPDGTLLKQKWPRFSRLSNWNQAPEVAKGRLYDPRPADVWSIGATVYWLIVRTYPIDYRSTTRMTKQLEHRFSFMHKVSDRCMAFVKSMLVFQPVQRPTIGQALELEWITGETKTSPADAEASELVVDRGEPGDTTGPEETGFEPGSTSGQVQPPPDGTE